MLGWLGFILLVFGMGGLLLYICFFEGLCCVFFVLCGLIGMGWWFLVFVMLVLFIIIFFLLFCWVGNVFKLSVLWF